MTANLTCRGLLTAILLAGSFAAADETKIRFNRDIRPILSDKCFRCHGPDANHREADLRFDIEQQAKGDRGGYRAIAAGRPEESEMMVRILSSDDDQRMPPPDSGKQLTSSEVALLRRWIEQGAEYQAHWSFLPARRPPVPTPPDGARWCRNEIDRFILERLAAAGLEPSPRADAVTLVRRLCFDLNGLPPNPADVTALVQNDSERAYEQLADRLLDSPHYGERMAMMWLDLVRYADSVGYHGDQEHPITPYRDYVIKALNDNMPFDQFTREQLAGDLLPDASIDQKIASGYNRVLQTSHEGGVQQKEYLSKYDADRVRNLGGVWMGATLGCVQCHDHKYDPYTQKDFYRLVAFFADVDDSRTFKGGDTSPTKREPELVVLSPLDRDQVQRLEAQISELKAREKQRGDDTDSDPAAQQRDEPLQERVKQLQQQIEKLESQKRRTMVTEAVSPRTIRVLKRGDWMDESGEVVEPGVPEFLLSLDVTRRRPTRLDLASWLTSPEHPQTARVFVNRVWCLLLGTGLCPSLDDTGSQGEWPTHPELLDYLAVEFIESGWDIKHIVKLIVMSSTYRQSSLAGGTLLERDPENRLFARQSRFRLPAEMVRDNVLALSGLLVERIGGPSAHPYQPAGYYAHLNFPKRVYQADEDDNQYRRGVYMHWQRQFLHPMLQAFDAPTREECTAKRPLSNTPLAALVLLNDPTFIEAARVLAQRALSEGGRSDEQRVAWLWQTAVSRAANPQEREPLIELLEWNRQQYASQPELARRLLSVGLAPQPDDVDAVELAAWTAVTRAVLNLDETISRY